ncbi:stalk domain-containing protein [Marinicrinis lubricantis]|uniref:Stalk domain-containing protein n=1 Tax=Marinicrinis lubricantis TaxID=2086470 RepID=A0ABW1IPJ8_9BACL
MTIHKNKKKRFLQTLGISMTSLALAMSLWPAGSAQAVSATASHVLLYLDQKEAFINNEPLTLDAPAAAINGSTYVPMKFLAETLGFKLEWDADTGIIEMTSDKHYVSLDEASNTAFVDGAIVPYNSVALVRNNRLMVKLTWLADIAGAKYTYNKDFKRVEMYYTSVPDNVYDEVNGNTLPVAKFATDKQVYRIGEPIRYIDLSYDPDGDAISYLNWEGKKQAFFEAGEYKISLKVTDSKGAESKVYTQKIKVTEKVYLTEDEFPLYYSEPGTAIKISGAQRGLFQSVNEILYNRSVQTERKILFSDSPETITQHGILYRDTVIGKARLYANHLNGMEEQADFYIFAKNVSDHNVTVKTTNKGEVYPSLYAQLFGQHAAMDFLLDNKTENSFTLAPGETAVYVKMPRMYPAQGFNVLYDVESDGAVEYIFAALRPGDDADELSLYPDLPYVKHIRGTFTGSEVNMKLSMPDKSRPQRLTIGDGKLDTFMTGYDPMRGIETSLMGNYGVIYNIELENPGNMAVLIMPRGGNYKGPVVVNGIPQMVPKSGVLSVYDGAQLIARTTEADEKISIQLTPAAGSSLPVSVIFYPLQDK